MRQWKGIGAITVLALTLGGAGLAQRRGGGGAPQIPFDNANPYQQLHFRFIGPTGNRAIAVAGEPGNPLVAYYGAASGGIWKTTDGGTHWAPIFDQAEVSSVSALAVAPSAPNILWAGTGETYLIRAWHAMGDGVYKSQDRGATWAHMGLDRTGHVGRVVISPRDPDVVFACAVGEAYKPSPERGVYRTSDGGKSWQQVLKVDDNTGCSDISMDAHDPQTLYAGMWQFSIKTWDEDSGGAGSGVFVTHDGGDTWQKLTGHGLPAAGAPLGKIAVGVAPRDPNRVYALIQQDTATLYRSDDAGRNWEVVNRNHVMAERSPYYTRFTISPDDPNLLYFPSVSWSVSRDGGRSFDTRATSAGGDLHEVWVDPLDSSRILTAQDSGGSISLNRGVSYYHVTLPIAQIYHVFTDNQIPYHVLGNKQDDGSNEGPSNTLGGGLSTATWHAYGGCESGFGIPDPMDSNIIWSGCYNGMLDRIDLRTGQIRSVDPWPEATYGYAPKDARDRWNWTFPVAISPHDHNQVYAGSQYVYQTNDGGASWRRISPDLTLNDPSHEGNSGGIAFDNLMTFDGAILYAIAESPVTAGVIWTGSNDGQVSLTRDGGKTWANVTKNIPGLPPWGTVDNIFPSKYAAGAAYITVDLQMVGNYDPFVYKTTDYGQSWTALAGGIPRSVSSFCHFVLEDPVRPGMLYLGTDNALYLSWDDGAHWTRLRNNLPPAPVYWLEVEPRFNDLVIATHGRGIYILDDITALRDFDHLASGGNALLPPRPAYRFRVRGDTRYDDPNGAVVGENPPYGAVVNYYLAAPSDHVEMSFSGADGQTLRTVSLRGQKGLNRTWWDLRSTPPHAILYQVSPPGEPWVPGARPFVDWTHMPQGPKVVPGTYTVKLSVDGAAAGSAPLELRPDPNDL
ncbi:MAG: WD40/YVTN/BNR-like repeat-containing protein, partial [Terriglobales bacterium]